MVMMGAESIHGLPVKSHRQRRQAETKIVRTTSSSRLILECFNSRRWTTKSPVFGSRFLVDAPCCLRQSM